MTDAYQPFDLLQSARRLGHLAWVEMRLFETLGAWVPVVPELDVKLHLGTSCPKHAWHGELLQRRLPEIAELNAEVLTQPANEAVVRVLDAVREPAAADLTIEKLVGVYRVLVPHLVTTYRIHQSQCSPVADASTMRSLRFVLQDETEDWHDGEMLLRSLIRTPDHVRRATAHQAMLEELLLAAGGVTGAMPA